MIEAHNWAHMTPEERAVADIPEVSDEDFNRLFPNG